MADFHSILWDRPGVDHRPPGPETLSDLNLDQIIAAVLPDGEQEPLRVPLRTPLRDVASVDYRHDVFRDLEQEPIRAVVIDFVLAMRQVRRTVSASRTVYHRYQQRRIHLDAALSYCRAIVSLDESAVRSTVASRGLRGWFDHLRRYVAGPDFQRLVTESAALRDQLDQIRYSISVKGLQVTVGTFGGGPYYGAVIADAFARFEDDASIATAPSATEPWPDMNHVEEQILDRVVELHPNQFRALDEYCGRFDDFADPVVDTFVDEVQFYLCYLVFVDRMTARGLHFCYPEVTGSFDGISAAGAYDLALGLRLLETGKAPVHNDFQLSDGERVLVVTGPNQGGKSTFARMFGQLTHLAAVGCPVPARQARILLADNLFTHFERPEYATDPAGKLQDELTGMNDTLSLATDRSVVIMNESFSSTTTADGLAIGADVLRRIIEKRSVAVYVTFLDELATLDPAVVSMVAGVGVDPTERTFRVERGPADGKAHAVALAGRFGLTYDAITERMTQCG